MEIRLAPGEVLLICRYCVGSGFWVPYEHWTCRACGGTGWAIFDPARFPELGGQIPSVKTWGERNDPLVPHPLYDRRARRRRGADGP